MAAAAGGKFPVNAGAGGSAPAVVPGAVGRAGGGEASGGATERVGAEVEVVSCGGKLAGRVAGRVTGPVGREEEAITA
jgi:hypothetical protein